MDASHQTLLRLYDEPLPVGLPPQPPDEAELLALMETKAWLDARAPRALRPDAFALDAIFRAAAHGSPDGEVLPGVRHDRAPLRRPNRFHRAWTVAGSVGALATLAVLAFTVVLRPAPPASVVTAVASAPVASAAATPPTADAPASASLAALPAPVAAAAPAASAPSEKAAPTPPVAKAAAPLVAVRSAASRPADVRSAATAVPASVLLADDDAAIASAKARAVRLRARLDSALWDAPPVAPSMGAPSGTSVGVARRFTQASHQ